MSDHRNGNEAQVLENSAQPPAFAAWGQFSWRDVPAYVAGQLTGAILAAAVLCILFHPMLDQKEHEKSVKRGKPGSVITG